MIDSSQDNPANVTQERDALRAKIVEAFHGVSLEGGIGLRQADGIDSRKSEDVCRLLREGDEKDDWSQIPQDDLDRYSGSLTFLDPDGMRFYLPAFMLADIDQQGSNCSDQFDLLSRFIDLSDHSKKQFSLLSLQQRSVVADYLRYVQDQPGHWLYVHRIDYALESFWDPVPEFSEEDD
jgi:hypothetical protein